MSSDYLDFVEGLRGLYSFINEISHTLESCRLWYQKNAAVIDAYLNAFADFGVWLSAVERMSERQIVFTDDLPNEFASIIYTSTDVDSTVLDYYLDNDESRMNALITRCSGNRPIENFGILYEQIICAYLNEHYHLACIGLFSILDGLLSELSLDINSTGFKKRLELIQKKLTDRIELSNFDKKLWCVYISTDSFIKTVSANKPFTGNEPEGINRNWVLHGHTRRQYSKLDFLKVLLCIDAIILLDNTADQSTSNEMEQ